MRLQFFLNFTPEINLRYLFLKSLLIQDAAPPSSRST
jgi:hypothetical protein